MRLIFIHNDDIWAEEFNWGIFQDRGQNIQILYSQVLGSH
jgi:hypothetical protein